MSVDVILIVLAILCFVAEAIGIKTRVSLGWIGLALWALAALV